MSRTARESTNKLLEMIENGALDRDNVIMACVKYMSEADVADMMRINEMNPEPDFDQYDDDAFDVAAMRFDYDHGNFDPDRDDPDEYQHVNIVAASIRNGQFAQAEEQCARFRLDYAEELERFNAWEAA